MERHDNFEELFKDYPKEIILKDGTGVTLRPLRSGDEKALFEMFNRFSQDELWFLNHDVTDPLLIDGWVRDLDQNRTLSIVAELTGRVIANAALMVKHFGAKSHIGKIRISVDPGFREKRLGTWMLLDLVNLAMAIGLKILIMRLVQERDRSIMEGAKKLGFVEEAVLNDYVMDRDERPCNLIIMIKRLPSY